MFLDTISLRYPSADTPPIAIPSTHVIRLREEFIRDGKLLFVDTLVRPDGLLHVTGRLFRDKAAFDEWEADPIVQARALLHKDHYTRNQIEITRSSFEF